MQLENPKEYLPLVKGEDNFSEVYGLRYEILCCICTFLGPTDIKPLARHWDRSHVGQANEKEVDTLGS